MKTALRCCVAVAWAAISSLPTGCSTGSPVPAVSSEHSRLYQPRLLRLPAGRPVPTLDGPYQPTADEVWHSPAAFADLEAKLLNALAALDQNRNRTAP